MQSLKMPRPTNTTPCGAREPSQRTRAPSTKKRESDGSILPTPTPSAKRQKQVRSTKGGGATSSRGSSRGGVAKVPIVVSSQVDDSSTESDAGDVVEDTQAAKEPVDYKGVDDDDEDDLDNVLLKNLLPHDNDDTLQGLNPPSDFSLPTSPPRLLPKRSKDSFNRHIDGIKEKQREREQPKEST